MARWLAVGGAEHVVLTSRRGLAAEGAVGLRDELVGLGVRVTVAACDVADAGALGELLAGLGGSVSAVVHAAGVAQSTPLGEVGLGELEEVLRAKTAGAVNLDRAFADVDLDAFVVFSSNAGTWGSGGQAAYAAAN
ncbi:SDR family NAD(P)-dependent oxidoreductase, partial [Actinoplanes sp. DH11]|uniref:SDR family NAD(P)-dependent oxidoreductase n=1 Tax=Actinoplanes sp. DH11 TaxID=2857011 RepID=UPI001E5EF37A